MKKYFLFAAVAGMLASCSSESLTKSESQIEPTQEDRVPILLGVSSPSVDVSRGATRGTGTVGGVGTSTNQWEGQTIRAFMFTKGNLTLANDGTSNLYDNAEMITPGTADNLIPGASTATNIGEAMLSDGTIQYYPSSGNYDFFGYHADDATDYTVDDTGNPWTVDFKINGSQDLMSTKAVLVEQAAGTIKQETWMGGSTDFYSAKAARKGVQPILSFNHLLTRLSFVVKAGNDDAGGWSGGAQDITKAVYVKSIKVESKTTGKMAVAWTTDPGDNMITWTGTGTPEWLTLKERPTYYKTLDKTITVSDAEYAVLPFYYKNSDPTARISVGEWTLLPAADPGDGSDWQGNYTILTAAECSAIASNDANYNLTTLTPTAPAMTHSTATAPEETTTVGEALIVAPSTTDYQMKVKVSQKVPTNWNTPAVLTEKEQEYDLVIPVPAGGFLKNTSYLVKLTLYGFERIKVTTEIIPWTQGATITVGED